MDDRIADRAQNYSKFVLMNISFMALPSDERCCLLLSFHISFHLNFLSYDIIYMIC